MFFLVTTNCWCMLLCMYLENKQHRYLKNLQVVFFSVIVLDVILKPHNLQAKLLIIYNMFINPKVIILTIDMGHDNLPSVSSGSDAKHSHRKYLEQS